VIDQANENFVMQLPQLIKMVSLFEAPLSQGFTFSGWLVLAKVSEQGHLWNILAAWFTADAHPT
jgi:hypothetical protein